MSSWGNIAGGKKVNKNAKKKQNGSLFGNMGTDAVQSSQIKDSEKQDNPTEKETKSFPKKPLKPKINRTHIPAPVPINTSDPIIRFTPNNQDFVSAHRGLLTSGSDYFAGFFRPGPSKYIYGTALAENVVSFVNCPDTLTPAMDVLQAYTQYLYMQVIPMPAEDKFTFLARLYIFGEAVVHATFCNAVMDTFIDLHVKTQKTSFDDVVPLVWERTPEASPMRKLLVDVYAHNLEEDPGLVDVLEALPKGFLVRAMMAMAGVKGKEQGCWEYLEGEGPCDTLVQLAVGPDPPTIMNIHLGVITKSSGFFKSAFKPEWASQLKLYVSWRYTGDIAIPLYQHDDSTSNVIRATEAEKVYVALAHTYIFSERIVDNAYTNAILERIIAAEKAGKWNPGPEFAKVLYAGTLPGCSARRLFADMIGWLAWDDVGQVPGWATWVEGYNKEMLVDIMKSVIQSRKESLRPNPWDMNLGAYLEEEDVGDR
ncbi:hypothetical protein CC86DRAFT_405592 [Ophiobolus disseminans]|uniref:BTB domain-containing protein n=1 Tax=Ophiobolus disseminans TaxID=1469910 RepID=A0A6A7A2Y7_9PLEO|nr:hypothetical protein CC86DRAFT_405592 [Ophiobolus disseminans]